MTAALISRDYQGMTFQFREDGYFNMTVAAKHFGKRLDHFFANEETNEYICQLDELLDLKSPEFRVFGLVDTRRGRNGGTWAHPKLAVFFARWLDVKFAVWCDMVIDDLLRGKAQVTITKPEESAVMALPKNLPTARYSVNT